MKQLRINFAAEAAVVFLLFVFIGSAIAALVMGTRAESSAAAFSEFAFSERTLLSFLAEKLRQGDGAGDIYVGEFDGINALFIESTLGDVIYTDIFYFCDDSVRELFCEKGALFMRSDGTRLVSACSVVFSEPEPGLIYIETTSTDGDTIFLYIFLRSGGQL